MNALFFGSGRPGARPTFRIGSIPVRVEFSFFIIALLLGFRGGPGIELAIWVAAVFVSVLLHELGHALAYRSRGALAEIILYGGGGLTLGRREAKFGIGERIYTSFAGPAFGLLFGGAIFLFRSMHGPLASPLANEAIYQLLWINVGWGLFNLLPVLPMDGGHILEALLSIGNEVRGRVWARYVSIALCLALMWPAIHFDQLWIAMLLALFAMQSFQTLPLVDPRRQQAQQPVRPEAPPPELPDVIENLGRLHKLLGEDRPGEARAVAFQVLEAARGPGARDQALRALAWLAVGQGEPQEALGYLAKTSPRFDDPLTWGTAIAASGDALGAIPHLARAYQRSADPQTVATYARCLVAVGRMDEARKLATDASPLEVQRALAEALFRSRDFQGAAAISRRIYERAREPLDAYNLACAESRLGNADEAMRWLRTAVEGGFSDREHLEQDADLEPLRSRAEFSELVARLPPLSSAGTA